MPVPIETHCVCLRHELCAYAYRHSQYPCVPMPTDTVGIPVCLCLQTQSVSLCAYAYRHSEYPGPVSLSRLFHLARSCLARFFLRATALRVGACLRACLGACLGACLLACCLATGCLRGSSSMPANCMPPSLPPATCVRAGTTGSVSCCHLLACPAVTCCRIHVLHVGCRM